MTFDEFRSLKTAKKYDEYTEIMFKTLYQLGPATWCSDIQTKKLVLVKWKESAIRYKDISLAEEIERRKQYKLLNKMYKAQERLDKMNDDFQ